MRLENLLNIFSSICVRYAYTKLCIRQLNIESNTEFHPAKNFGAPRLNFVLRLWKHLSIFSRLDKNLV